MKNSFSIRSIHFVLFNLLLLPMVFGCGGSKRSESPNDPVIGRNSSLNTSESISEITEPYFNLVRKKVTGNLAYQTTAFVEKYWRVVGNTGFNESVRYIAKHLEDAGFVEETVANGSERFIYRIEKRGLDNPTWEPVSASLKILGQEEILLEQTTNRNMVCLNSGSTPQNGIEAEVIHIKNLQNISSTDFSGKIVFAEMSPSQLYRNDVFENGAIGIITYDNPDYLQPEKNYTSIQFRSLPHKYSDKWGIALSYISKEKLLKQLKNGPVRLKVNIQTKSYNSEELTIIANVRGTKLPNESLVFSAHIQEPGANDNATGVGTQLEMAIATVDLIKKDELKLDRTLTFLWGDEIVSTQRYITEQPQERPEIMWGISLDMVGENTSVTGGSFLIEKMPDPSAIYTRGSDKHTEWGGSILKEEDMKPHYLNDLFINIFQQQGEYAKWEVNTNPFEGGSDHTPFLKADIPGLLLWHFTDQFYHTDNDRLDKVSQSTMKNVGTAALVVAYTLLNADKNTARIVSHETYKAAIDRLETEYQLSKIELQSGKTTNDEITNDEIKILKSWSHWYEGAIESTKDLSKSKDIYKNKKRIKEYTSLLINKLAQ